ncbi:hypothetical protein [Nonomuraea rubra]|uniref:hypothetical protein n=1 Tax=Nonomuraea rubra TaxID=46180 RepID=UPI003CD07A3E
MTGAPVVTTLMALGSFPGSHPQNLGMPGMHGSVAAVGALQQADPGRGAGGPLRRQGHRPRRRRRAAARIVHADIDESEISRSSRRTWRCPATAGTTITGLLGLLARDGGDRERLDPWWARPARVAAHVPARLQRTRGRLAQPAVRRPDPRPARRSGGLLRRRGRASTRCGPRSSSPTSTRARSSTPAAWARWGSRSRPRWGRAWPVPAARSG